MSNDTRPTSASQHWAQKVTQAVFDPDVHRPDVYKGDRVSFRGPEGATGTIYGHVSSLTSTGYRIGFQVGGDPEQGAWVEVDAAHVTPAPLAAL